MVGDENADSEEESACYGTGYAFKARYNEQLNRVGLIKSHPSFLSAWEVAAA